MLALGAAAGLQLLPFLTGSPESLTGAGLLTDDAFFYSVLAGRFGQAGFLTFDGVQPTNGVQPLWMGIQLVLAWLWPAAASVTRLAVSSWAAYVLFVLAAAWFFVRGSLARQAGSVALLSLVVLNPGFLGLAVRGLEGPVTLLGLVCMWSLWEREESAPPIPGPWLSWRLAGLAVTAAWCFYSRTDLFWIGAVTAGWLAWRRGWRSAAGFSLLLGALVLPYNIGNLLTQGSLMPISGQVKLHYLSMFAPTLGDYLRTDEWRGWFQAVAVSLPGGERLSWPVRVAAGLGVLLGGQWLAWRRPGWFPAGTRVFSLAVACHWLFMHTAYRELRPYTAYYFLPEVLWAGGLLMFGLGAWLDREPARTRLTRPATAWSATAAAAVIAVVLWRPLETRPVGYWAERLQLARDIRREVPVGEAVGAFWPGCFAAFSGRDLVPLDGIIASHDYFQHYVKTGRELAYAAGRGIRFVAVYLPEAPDTLFARRPLVPENWSHLGLVRLQAYPGTLTVRAARTLAPNGAGWYLLELHPPGPEKG